MTHDDNKKLNRREFWKGSAAVAVGQVTDKVLHDNVKAWSGDHCIDPSLVPGVLFCNRKVDAEKPRLMDIGPTVLDMFGVDVPKYMDGRSLVVADVIDNPPSPRLRRTS